MVFPRSQPCERYRDPMNPDALAAKFAKKIVAGGLLQKTSSPAPKVHCKSPPPQWNATF